jgi:hypothetical protein
MSEQTRYRTLVNSVGTFYGAALKNGLLEILKLQASWAVIRDDTRRFLAIWAEYAGFNDTVLEKQLLGMLDEFAQSPSLVVAEKISHVVSLDMEVESECESESEAPAVVVTNAEEAEVEEAEEEEEEEEEEAEEAEEAEEEAEEEGMEVEQVTIRGRKYFKDVKTNKLYVDDNDEPGEEAGAIVNGKPVFLK